MNKKIVGVIVAVIAGALFAYMYISGGSAPMEAKTDINGVVAQNTIVEADTSKAALVIDEQALALEEMQREAGKSGLSKLYIVKCSSCHGKDGKGPIGPSIAGKDSEYNFEALMKYKKGQVPNTMMKGLLDKTSEAELKLLANEVTTFK